MHRTSRLRAPVQRALGIFTGLGLAAMVSTVTLYVSPVGAQQTSALARSSQFYEDAQKRYERQDLEGAALQLRNALQQDKSNLAAHLLLGRVLLDSNQPKAAEASLEEALRQGVSAGEVFPLLGQVYLRVGEPQKLLETIQLKDGRPQARAEIALLRGSAHAMRGAISSALADFAQAKQLDPSAPGPWISEVPLLLRNGNLAEAVASANKATELAPDNAQAWQQLGTVQLAQGLSERALQSLDRALKLQPKLVDALVAKAGLLMGQNRRGDAKVLLEQMKVAKVRDPRAAMMRSFIAQEEGRTDLARQEQIEASELVDAMPAAVRAQNDAALIAGAMAHRALGNRERTREYLDTLMARNPKHMAARLAMAEVLLEERQASRAASLLEGVLRDAPMDPQALMLMGRTHLARRQYDLASEMFDRAMRVGGGSQAQRELGLAQVGANQGRAALISLEKAYAQDPSDLRTGIELAVLYARLGNRQKAIQIAEAVVAKEPRNPAMLNFLGNIKGRLGDNAGLRKAYEQALAIDPAFRQVLVNLTQLDMEEGRFEPARKRLGDLLRKDADDLEVLFLAGQLEERARRPQQAEEFWQRANGTQSKDPRPGLALADLKLAQRKAPEALAITRSLATRFPEAIPVLQAHARVQVANQQVAGARTTLQDAARLAGFDTEALVSTARMQLAADDATGAAQSVRKALQARPSDLGALVTQVELAARAGDAAGVDTAMRALNQHHAGKVPALMTAGHIAMSRRQTAQALASYRVAFDKEPGAQTALPLVQAHLAANQPAQALTLMRDVVKRFPNDPLSLRSLAELQLLQGQLPEARQSFARLVELRPDDAEQWMTYARILAELKDPTALATAEKAVRLDPSHAGLAAAFGVMLVNRGEGPRGLRLLQDARLRDPGNTWIRVQLATALHAAGQTTTAREELRAALAGNPAPPPSAELNRLKAALGL
jgi:putative PEP-CTERM system TPR-repeat lipoprotein